MTRIGEKVYDLLSLEKTYYLTYGRDIILQWCKEYIISSHKKNLKILDIGCGCGTDLINIKSYFTDVSFELYGVECYEPNVEEAKKSGIMVFSLDMEREYIPVAGGFFDIIMNQFLEHTKEIFWIFSEISRSVKRNGIVVIGVPNLASWSNRLWLLAGTQPSSIELMGPHIRGFTAPNFKRFIETDGYFKLLKVAGSNFWPFPSASVCKSFSKIFPTLSVSLFFLLSRENKDGEFIHVLDTRFFETPYFRGNGLK